MDLVGFGRSDKPSQRSDYTYQRHVDWIRSVLQQLDLQGITLVCQDWGGLVGLRQVVEAVDRDYGDGVRRQRASGLGAGGAGAGDAGGVRGHVGGLDGAQVGGSPWRRRPGSR